MTSEVISDVFLVFDISLKSFRISFQKSNSILLGALRHNTDHIVITYIAIYVYNPAYTHILNPLYDPIYSYVYVYSGISYD